MIYYDMKFEEMFTKYIFINFEELEEELVQLKLQAKKEKKEESIYPRIHDIETILFFHDIIVKENIKKLENRKQYEKLLSQWAYKMNEWDLKQMKDHFDSVELCIIKRIWTNAYHITHIGANMRSSQYVKDLMSIRENLVMVKEN